MFSVWQPSFSQMNISSLWNQLGKWRLDLRVELGSHGYDSSFKMRMISDDFPGMAAPTPLVFASCTICSCVLPRRKVHDAHQLFSSVPSHDLVYSAKCRPGNLCCYRRLLYVAVSRENVWNWKQIYFSSRMLSNSYGVGAPTDFYKLFMTMFSPWQWFCSTRTFSNSLEMTLTIVALYYWPWNISSDAILGPGSDPSLRDEEGRPIRAKPSESGAFATPISVKRYVPPHS